MYAYAYIYTHVISIYIYQCLFMSVDSHSAMKNMMVTVPSDTHKLVNLEMCDKKQWLRPPCGTRKLVNCMRGVMRTEVQRSTLHP